MIFSILFASEVLAPLRGAVTCPVACCSLDRSGDQRRQECALPPPHQVEEGEGTTVPCHPAFML